MGAVENFAAVAGPIAGSCLLSAPILTVRKLQAAKDTGAMSPNYFIFQFLACAFWLIYGLLVSSASIVACNAWGCAVASFCMMCFLNVLGVMEGEGRPSSVSTMAAATRTSIITFGGAVAFALILAALASSSTSSAITLCGLVSAGLSTAQLASPLESVKHIFAVKSADTLSPVTIGAAIVNCTLWVIYGTCRTDYFVVVPNFLGLLSSIALMGLVVRFGTAPPAARASPCVELSSSATVEVSTMDLTVADSTVKPPPLLTTSSGTPNITQRPQSSSKNSFSANPAEDCTNDGKNA